MKTSFFDYVVSTMALLSIIFITGFLTAVVSIYISRPLLGNYFVLADGALFLIFFGLCCSAFAKLTLKLFPFEAGEYEMDSPVFFRWKLFTVLVEFGRKSLSPFTVVFFRPVVERLFGAKIGKNVAIGGSLVDGHMITLEDGAIVGERSIVSAHYIMNGKLILQPAVLRKDSTVGGGAVVFCSEIGENSVIVATSLVPPGSVIPAQELWGGFPARKIRKVQEAPDLNATKAINRI